jgi:hypothetical protein
MKLIKVFLKNINVLNLLLLAMAIFLFFELDDSLVDKKNKVTISKPKEVLIGSEEKATAANAATYLDYVVITEKNLFHPERKMPSEKKEELQLAKPEFILYGTLITGEKRVAYIEDRKNPYSTPGREKRQVAVNEGDMIAGYKLAEVNAESILLVRGEDKIIVTLSSQKERKTGEATVKTISPGAVPYSTSGQMPPPSQPQARPTQPYIPPMPPMPARPTLNLRGGNP